MVDIRLFLVIIVIVFFVAIELGEYHYYADSSFKKVNVPVISSQKGAKIITVGAKPCREGLYVNIAESEIRNEFRSTILKGWRLAEKISGVKKGVCVKIFGSGGGAIDGSSAGFALAVLMLAIMEDRDLKDGFAITGGIDDEGNVLASGGLSMKLKAVESNNLTLFLLPASSPEQILKSSKVELVTAKNIKDALKYVYK